jgi:hypothetical protein
MSCSHSSDYVRCGDEVERLEGALRICLTAMQRNIGHGAYKDDQALADGIDAARRALGNKEAK